MKYPALRPAPRHSPFTAFRPVDFLKKKEASAGSGGTTTNALAGGGNQSLLTATVGQAWGKDPAHSYLMKQKEIPVYSTYSRDFSKNNSRPS